MGTPKGIGKIVAALAALASLALPAAAGASFHLTKVSEVFTGTGPTGDDAFIELQMFEAGQNLVGGHKVDYYTQTGTLLGSYTIASDVANGDNQRTILIGDTAAAGSPDFVNPTLGDALYPGTAAGGAVCFPDAQPVDCMSFGNFTGAALLPGETGSPAAPAGIPSGTSLSRSIAPGCATLLEPSDDTDNSATDFTVGTPSPRNNSVTPTEVPCVGGDTDPPETTITRSPKNKIHRKSAVYRFTSDEQDVTYECKVDRKPFKSCTSPKRIKRLADGRHSFKVRATDAAGNVDTSAARDRFRVDTDHGGGGSGG